MEAKLKLLFGVWGLASWWESAIPASVDILYPLLVQDTLEFAEREGVAVWEDDESLQMYYHLLKLMLSLSSFVWKAVGLILSLNPVPGSPPKPSCVPVWHMVDLNQC